MKDSDSLRMRDDLNYWATFLLLLVTQGDEMMLCSITDDTSNLFSPV